MSNPQILAHLIADWKDKKPDLDVLTFVDIDPAGQFVTETRTYRQLWENGQRLAQWLQQQGLQKGDHFALIMANHPEFVDLMVASSILGAVFVPIDPRTQGEKLRYMLEFAECKGAIVTEPALDALNSAWQGRDECWRLLVGQSQHGLPGTTDIIAATQPLPELSIVSEDPREAMQLLFTSGTTGDPKAIVTAHERFAAGKSVGEVLELTEQDRPYTGLSLTHANAQIITLGSTLYMGLRGVISRKFTKSRLWDITREFGCTVFNLLGGMTTALYAEPVKDNDADNPVRTILSAGMPAQIWMDFEKRFGVRLTEFYGAAEGGLTFNPFGVGPIGSCGKPPANLEMAIFTEDGRRARPNEAGEICFRNADGSAPPVSYFKNPEATAKKVSEGWLRMGDIGHVDVNGWLFFHFRKGGGIRRNGDFINTAYVEKALSGHDSIDDVFVYGIAIEGGAPGEKEPVAAIVVKDDFDPRSVFQHCAVELDRNSVPQFLQVVAEIPKTASEKPQERFLIDAFNPEAGNIYNLSDYPG